MVIILVTCLIIALPIAVSAAVTKRTLIDEENRRDTPRYYVHEDEDGNDVVHPFL